MALRVESMLDSSAAPSVAAGSAPGTGRSPSRCGGAAEPLYLDRDESDLAYVRRIAARGADEGVPLFERLRFLEIAQSVLDEFVAVRLCHAEDDARAPIEAGIATLRKTLLEHLIPLCAVLARADVILPGYVAEAGEESDAVLAAARRELLPGLTPLTVDAEHPFPQLRHGQRALILTLDDDDGRADSPLIVPLPPALDTFVRIARNTWMRSDQLLRRCAGELVPGRPVAAVALLRVLRENDLAITRDCPSLRDEIERGLEQRARNPVVCVEASDGMDDELTDFVLGHLGGEDPDARPSMLRLPWQAIAAATGLRDLARREAAVVDGCFPLHRPAALPELARHGGDLFAAMAERDFLLHSPYQDFAALERLLWQASGDPAVVAIRQTLYRTDAGVVGPLLRAARNGKDVTVVVEIEARENERDNIVLSRELEHAGAHIVHGIVGLKVHAKLLHIVRREAGRLREYAVFSTGNFHPGNAIAYGDLTLFTADPELAADLRRLVNYVTGHLPEPGTTQLAVAPHNLRRELLALIECEADNARAGRPSGIWFKVNSLLDREIIDALYAASQAGVPIHGSVRRHCALRPRVAGLSETTEIRSLIGRFLEHARVFCFANGAEMESAQARFFIASADWMPRNLDSRVEVLVPIRDERLKSWLAGEFRQAYLDDDADSWRLEPDGTYTRIPPSGRSAQARFAAGRHGP